MTAIVELILFIGLVCWYFNGRGTIMVDVISARVQEAYVGWKQNFFADDDRSKQHSSQRPNVANATIMMNTKRRQILEKESVKLMRDNSLYQIKEVPSKANTVIPPPRPYMGLSCSRCTPSSRESLVHKITKRSNVINLLTLNRTHKFKGFFARNFYDVAETFNIRTYDYQQLSPLVMNDERLKQAIEQFSKEKLAKQENETSNESEPKKKPTFAEIYKEEEKKTHHLIKTMRSTISNFLLRLTSWTLFKLLPFFVSSVAISPNQMEMLKTASDSGIPLIFIPLHRSHLDYILVTFILLNNDIRSPLVAAGDNLKIPLFGWLLRGLGAFYIRRRLEVSTDGGKDTLYRVALHTYITHCLRAQNNLEFFIEGGRTRTGKPLLPKCGILSVIVDAYLDGTVEDALLVPVSMNYDKLVDGNFVREQTGTPKQMESFTGAIKSIWEVLNSNYGAIRVDFNQPFSIRELVRTFQQNPSKLSPPPLLKNPSNDRLLGYHKNTEGNGSITIQKLGMDRKLSSRLSCSSIYGTDIAVEEQRGLVETIARHVVYDCANATAIMSTNAVSFLLLTKFRNGCSLVTLAEALESLTNELIAHNRDVGFTGEPLDVINHAVNLLGPGLIIKEKKGDEIIIKPVLIQPNVIELSYYGNCLLPYFAMQSIVVTALQVIITSAKSSLMSIEVKHDELVDLSTQLCEIMSQEFILHKPCQQLIDVINDAIDGLVYREILKVPEEFEDDNHKWSRRVASTLDDCSDNYSNNSIVYNIGLDEKTVHIRNQLQAVLRPLIEVYSLTANCLSLILNFEKDYITESQYAQEVLSELRESLNNGSCCYGEAVSIDAIKNCIRLLRQWGVLDSHIDGRVRYLNVAKPYAGEFKLKKVSELIHKFKTEMPLASNLHLDR